MCALYHEARHRRMPMTRLVNELLSECLRDTPGRQLADAQFSLLQEEPPTYGDALQTAS